METSVADLISDVTIAAVNSPVPTNVVRIVVFTIELTMLEVGPAPTALTALSLKS